MNAKSVAGAVTQANAGTAVSKEKTAQSRSVIWIIPNIDPSLKACGRCYTADNDLVWHTDANEHSLYAIALINNFKSIKNNVNFFINSSFKN